MNKQIEVMRNRDWSGNNRSAYKTVLDEVYDRVKEPNSFENLHFTKILCEEAQIGHRPSPFL